MSDLWQVIFQQHSARAYKTGARDTYNFFVHNFADFRNTFTADSVIEFVRYLIITLPQIYY